MKLVAEIAGVSYYDDSDSVTSKATAETIRSVSEDKVIIIGGSGKDIDFNELAQVIEDNKVIHALLVGPAAVEISEALSRVGFTHFTIIEDSNMQKLIDTVYHLTEPGDALIFSPACKITDLFSDPVSIFEAAVLNLKERVDGQKQ